MYIHERRSTRVFIERFVEETRKLRTGDPMLEDTDVGPVIDTGAADRIMEWIEEAVESGGKILTGGERDGNIIQPTCSWTCRPIAGS